MNVVLRLEFDARAKESSQIGRRIYEATTSTMEDTGHEVADGVTFRLLMGQQPTPPLNQNSLLPVSNQSAEETTQTTGKEPEHQVADSGPKKEKTPGKTSKPNKPSKHSRAPDTESDEEVASRNASKKRKQEPSLAKQAKPNAVEGSPSADCKTIHIRDVENAFIFEYPYKSSLLWIVRCTVCAFQPKRHPLISITSVFMHWSARGHTHISVQDLLESHLVRVVGGNMWKAMENNVLIGARGKTECQVRRKEVSRYTTPEFMYPLLPRNKRREPRAGSSHHSNQPSRQLELRPKLATREPQAAHGPTCGPTPPPPTPRQQPEPADMSASNGKNTNGLANPQRPPLSGASAIEGPTNDTITVNTSPPARPISPEDNIRSQTLSPRPSTASRYPIEQRGPSPGPNSHPHRARGGPRKNYGVLDQTGGRGRDIA